MQTINLRTTNGLPVTHTTILNGTKFFSHMAANYERRNERWTETTEAEYYSCLGALRPALQSGRTFALGEAWKSNSNGEDIFAVFTFTGFQAKKRFFGRYMTLKEAQEFINQTK